jgi:hypothetical protein
MRVQVLQVVTGAVVASITLGGCAVEAASTEAALDAQAAQAGERSVGLAQMAAARLTLLQVVQAAGDYTALNGGSPRGFAAQFASSEPAVAGQLSALSDSVAQIRVEPGRCVVVTLPAGTPADTTC